MTSSGAYAILDGHGAMGGGVRWCLQCMSVLQYLYADDRAVLSLLVHTGKQLSHAIPVCQPSHLHVED